MTARRTGARAFPNACRCLAGVAVLLTLSLTAGAATVKKADDTTVVGPLVALEDGAIVLNVTPGEGKPPVRTSVPLADVVEVTIDPAADVPAAPPPDASPTASAPPAASAPSPDSQPSAAPPASPDAPADPQRSAATPAAADAPADPQPPASADAPADPQAPAATPTLPPGEALPAGDAPQAPPAARGDGGATGFESLFDGKELTAWEGDSNLWSVRDGAITGIANETNIAEAATFLFWKGGDLTDFELRFRYQISGGHPGSSGVVYRGKVLNPATFQVGGYQLDLGDDPKVSGSLYDEGGVAGNRGFLANVGEKVVLEDGDAREIGESTPGKGIDALRGEVKRGDWNEAVITVRGNHYVHTINGNVMADVTDGSAAALKSGVLALQLDLRQPVVVRFKDVQLRRTGDAAAAPQEHAWVVRLTGGDQLSGELLAWDDRQLKIKTAHGELSVPVTQLREVWHASADDINKARAARTTGAAPATEDVAFARRDKDQVVPVGGLALGVDGGSLRFRFRDAERKIALDKLVGVTLAAAEDAGGGIDGPLQQSLVLAGGSGDVVSGAWTALDAATGTITLDTAWGEPLRVPVKSVERVRTKNGRLVYLSDLPPAQVEQVPYFDRLLPYRLDQSLTGGPIKLAGSEHTRGIAVHARTVLRYDVSGRFERFRTKVGFQQPEGKAGRAVVRVLGDGDKVLHEIPDARGDGSPADLDLDVKGVNRLTLEVDFGADQDVADRVVWADARLIRAAAAGAAR